MNSDEIYGIMYKNINMFSVISFKFFKVAFIISVYFNNNIYIIDSIIYSLSNNISFYFGLLNDDY